MECQQVSERLSSFHDGELSEPAAREIQAHLASCRDCRQKLADMQALSRLVQEAQVPVPADLWHKIDARQNPADPAAPGRTRPRWWAMATAAAVLMAVGIILRLTSSTENHGQMQAVFARFFAAYHRDPEFANRVFLAEYAHEEANDALAQTLLGGPSITRRTSLAGCSLRERHVISMPCCRCLQSVYERKTGPPLVIFEHTEPRPEWFGPGTSEVVKCPEGTLCQIKAPHGTAITFKFGSHHVTVFGAKGLDEGREILRELGAAG